MPPKNETFSQSYYDIYSQNAKEQQQKLLDKGYNYIDIYSAISNKNESAYLDFNVEEAKEHLSKIRMISERYSTYSDETNPIVRYPFVEDLTSIEEVKNNLSNPNLQEKILTVLKFLSVQSKEEIIQQGRQEKIIEQEVQIRKRISYLRGLRYTLLENNSKSRNSFEMEWKTRFPHTKIPTIEELDQIILLEERKITELYKDNNLSEVKYNQTWIKNNIYLCNLYASSFIAALGMQNKLSQRIDAEGRPVTYKKEGEFTNFYIEDENGNLKEPTQPIKELGAKGIYEWLSTKGVENYGWKDITNLNYQQKLKLLEEGYIFYGASNYHNWLIIGVEVDGKMEPMLTQATYNYLLKPFYPQNVFGKEDFLRHSNLYEDRSEAITDYQTYSSQYANTFRLAPADELNDGKLFAIKVK